MMYYPQYPKQPGNPQENFYGYNDPYQQPQKFTPPRQNEWAPPRQKQWAPPRQKEWAPPEYPNGISPPPPGYPGNFYQQQPDQWQQYQPQQWYPPDDGYPARSNDTYPTYTDEWQLPTEEHSQYYHPDQHWSRFDRRIYLEDLPPSGYNYKSPGVVFRHPPLDWSSPANYPYQPLQGNRQLFIQDQQSLLEEEVRTFVNKLGTYTQHPEEIAFARYLAESIMIDSQLMPLQDQLNHDMRFNSRLLFDYFDTQHLSHLDFNEFKWGLNKLNIHFKNDECYNLFQRVASEDSRISTLEFHELLVGFRDQPSKFQQLGAFHFMHLPFNRSQNEQYLTVMQRDLINDVIELQLRIERNLTALRQIIGVDGDLLFALFRQLDRGAKGYLIIEDLRKYMQDMGGQFVQLYHLDNIFNRISKLRSDRINYNEFQTEFHIDTHHRLAAEREKQVSPKKTRQMDYIEKLHRQHQEMQQQQQQQQNPQPHQVHQPKQQHDPREPHEYAQFVNHDGQPPIGNGQPPIGNGQPPIGNGQQGFQQQDQQPPQRQPPSSIKPGQSDVSNLFFPGFTKVQLRKPQPPNLNDDN